MTDRAVVGGKPIDLEQIVAEDVGGRRPGGIAAKAITTIAIAWSLFQLWYASPLPFMLNVGIFSDTEARAFHLSFALLLAFACYPAFKSSPRDRVPILDICLAAIAVACVLYLVVFYRDLIQRPGLPTFADIAVSVIGVVLLIEITGIQGPSARRDASISSTTPMTDTAMSAKVGRPGRWMRSR